MTHIKIISFKVFILVIASVMLYMSPVLAESASINGVKLDNDEILMEAGQIDYDQEKGLALASHNITLTIKANGGQLQAESLSYDIEAGVITATGSVRFMTGDVVCETGSITYNLHDATGTTGAFKGKLTGYQRDVLLNGETLTVGRGPAEINNAGVTRCLLPNPHYKFYAKKITVSLGKAQLFHVVLYIKKIPVFYFPKFTLNLNKVEQESDSDLQVGFNGDEGLWLDYASILPTKSENFTWDYDARLATKGGLNLGLGFKAFGDLSNHLNFDYDFNGIWTVKDVVSFTYDSPFASFVINAEKDFSNSEADNGARLGFKITKDIPAIHLSIDGIKSFSPDKEEQLGFNLTRKYWKGPLGEWQIGIQGRQVSEVEEDGVVGGNYGGYQIDYKPNTHISLGYLQLYSFSGENYGDFEPNIGKSILYSADLPIGKEFSIGISGAYNFDESKLKSQILRFKQDTCCYTFSVSWDTVSNTWSVGPAFKF